MCPGIEVFYQALKEEAIVFMISDFMYAEDYEQI
jgi:hypothetical protein